MSRGQERYIIGCVGAGTEQMEAILEAAKQETEGNKAEEAVMRGRAVVAGRFVSKDCASPSIVGGTLADTDGMASETENASSAGKASMISCTAMRCSGISRKTLTIQGNTKMTWGSPLTCSASVGWMKSTGGQRQRSSETT